MKADRLQLIGYIVDMSEELKEMARQSQSPLLALLLEMVAQEGRDILESVVTPPEG
ncbi:hypothetical protein [Bartonella sp. DGB2]|uniref:hypothetical protein n=1 Tax=Bartonella sp. DGB2 TaxID=3388426 RepID=UPI0039901556